MRYPYLVLSYLIISVQSALSALPVLARWLSTAVKTQDSFHPTATCRRTEIFVPYEYQARLAIMGKSAPDPRQAPLPGEPSAAHAVGHDCPRHTLLGNHALPTCLDGVIGLPVAG